MEPPPLRYVRTSDGFDIAYTDVGRGATFVMAPHPFGDVQTHWREASILQPWFHGLAGRFRFVTYDSRGQGSSTRNLSLDTGIADYDHDLETPLTISI